MSFGWKWSAKNWRRGDVKCWVFETQAKTTMITSNHSTTLCKDIPDINPFPLSQAPKTHRRFKWGSHEIPSWRRNSDRLLDWKTSVLESHSSILPLSTGKFFNQSSDAIGLHKESVSNGRDQTSNHLQFPRKTLEEDKNVKQKETESLANTKQLA